MSHQRHRSDRSGFSMAEVMILLSVMVFALVCLFATVPSGKARMTAEVGVELAKKWAATRQLPVGSYVFCYQLPNDPYRVECDISVPREIEIPKIYTVLCDSESCQKVERPLQ